MKRAIITLVLAACVPHESIEIFHATDGHDAADYEEALLASGERDLACKSALTRSTASLHVDAMRAPRHADLDVVEGCGRRASYSKDCKSVQDFGNTVMRVTTTCAPVLLSRVDI